MKRLLFLLSLCAALPSILCAQTLVSIRKYGVSPENTPSQNRKNLQRAIDEASKSGTALFVEPAEKGYPMETGLILRRNVSLIGVHGPTGRGTSSADRKHPVGSLFVITDTLNAFITVESATQLKGLQFWYPDQSHNDPTRIIAYKPTIQMSQEKAVEGVTLSCLTFYGEYMAMDFRGRNAICEQILFEHCYGSTLTAATTFRAFCIVMSTPPTCASSDARSTRPSSMPLFPERPMPTASNIPTTPK